MKTKKDDRRSRRTQKLLEEALFSLMQEKRYDIITVQDIIDRANVGRSTFYSHYMDKEDLLINAVDGIIRFPDLGNTVDGFNLFPSLETFRHVQGEHNHFRSLVIGGSMDQLYKIMEGYFRKVLEKRLANQVTSERELSIPIPILAAHVVGSFLALLKWWLENKMIYTPEQMDGFFQQLVMPGVLPAIQNR